MCAVQILHRSWGWGYTIQYQRIMVYHCLVVVDKSNELISCGLTHKKQAEHVFSQTSVP